MCFLKASKWIKIRNSSYFLCREISERQTWRQESWSRISNTCLSLPFRKSGGRKRKRKSFVPKTANSRWRQNVVLPRTCLQDKTASSKPSWKMYSEKIFCGEGLCWTQTFISMKGCTRFPIRCCDLVNTCLTQLNSNARKKKIPDGRNKTFPGNWNISSNQPQPQTGKWVSNQGGKKWKSS